LFDGINYGFFGQDSVQEKDRFFSVEPPSSLFDISDDNAFEPPISRDATPKPAIRPLDPFDDNLETGKLLI
jgi:hypothetical protein